MLSYTSKTLKDVLVKQEKGKSVQTESPKGRNHAWVNHIFSLDLILGLFNHALISVQSTEYNPPQYNPQTTAYRKEKNQNKLPTNTATWEPESQKETLETVKNLKKNPWRQHSKSDCELRPN